MQITRKTVFNGVSGVGTLNSDPISCDQISSLTVICTTTGSSSPSATIKVQISNDVALGSLATFAPVNWVDAAGATAPIAADGTVVIGGMSSMSVEWVRVVYTLVSGTGGTITARLRGASQ